MRRIVDVVAFLAGLATLLALWVPEESVRRAIRSFLAGSGRMATIYSWSWCALVLPLAYGITFSRKYNGFTRLSLTHLLASVVLYEFWLGFSKGMRVLGYLAILFAGIVLVTKISPYDK